MMLGMYAAYYLFLSAGIQGTFGNVIGPYVAILLSGPLLFLFGYVHPPLPDLPGHRRDAARSWKARATSRS